MKNYGYIEPVIKPEDYVFGDQQLKAPVLQADGDWSEYFPLEELQIRQFETANCTGFSTTNIIEILMKRKYDLDVNYSDRFVGICAGTKPPGNSPIKVAQSIREHGMIPETLLPFSDDLQDSNEYYSFKGSDEDALRALGKKWTEEWDFGYDIVPATPDMMCEALQFSPLGAAGPAWFKDGNLYISPPGSQPNHWFTGCILKVDKGKSWTVLDNYTAEGSVIKKLAWDFNFGFVMRYNLIRKPAQIIKPKKRSFVEWLRHIIKIIFHI